MFVDIHVRGLTTHVRVLTIYVCMCGYTYTRAHKICVYVDVPARTPIVYVWMNTRDMYACTHVDEHGTRPYDICMCIYVGIPVRGLIQLAAGVPCLSATHGVYDRLQVLYIYTHIYIYIYIYIYIRTHTRTHTHTHTHTHARVHTGSTIWSAHVSPQPV